MSDYEPGTVALVTDTVPGSAGTNMAVRVGESVLTGEPVWMLLTYQGRPKADGGFVRDESVTDVRPLVVIDPENREQVERLVKLYTSEEAGRQLGTTEALTWALREYANPTPPKPEVYEHLIASHDGGLKRALCGKLWRLNARANVTVVGRCPECADIAESGWRA